MRYLFRRFVVFLLVVAFVGGFLAYSTVHWNRPELPRTELSGLGMSTYLYSARNLSDADETDLVSVSFSPEEASFLLENLDFSLEERGFRLVDVHLEGAGESVRIMMVLRGPMGFYYRSDFEGTIAYSSEEKRWTVNTSSLSLGPVPLHYVLPSVFHPDWPRTIGKDVLEIKELRLDGKGLKMSVIDVNFNAEELVE